MTDLAVLNRTARRAAAVAEAAAARVPQNGHAPAGSVEPPPAPSLPPFTPRYPLVSLATLATLPDPTYLVDGLLPAHGLTMLHGQPSAGKSLVALDWALSIASGNSTWMGRDLRPGRVVYVAAEGRGGLKHRIAAWRARWGISDAEPPLQFITEPLPLLDDMTADEFLNSAFALDDQPAPVLIVVDTLARCTPGADENSVGDMSKAINTLDRIRQETGGAVLLLHHNRKDSDTERGSSALRGAVDVQLSLSESDGVRELKVSKNRDGDDDVKVRFRLHPEGASVVLMSEAATSGTQGLPKSALKAYEAFEAIHTGVPVRSGDWLDASGLTRSVFFRAVPVLVRAGIVQHARGRGERGGYERGLVSP